MTQNLSLLNHLANGHSVTRVEALVALDIQNITARICDLRDAGVDVKTDVRIDPKGRRYARYFLDHKADLQVARAKAEERRAAAVAHDLSLATLDVRELGRVPGVRVERQPRPVLRRARVLLHRRVWSLRAGRRRRLTRRPAPQGAPEGPPADR